ncbi:MAG: [Fe-S]-binding protein [Chlamydiae bacterium]|nr:[Fe-S]-binding protein [Chlamydiota bacterium]
MNKKLQNKLDHLRYVGSFSLQEAEEKGMRLVTGKEGRLCLYWLVDETDGVIADAKFQAFGPIHLIAAAEIASELILRKNYDQASRISADLLDHHVRDQKDCSAFPSEASSFLNQVISAIDQAVDQCRDLPFAASYDVTPIETNGPIEGRVPGFDGFSKDEKLSWIQGVIDKEIRPYIELDAGGVQILDLKENGELHIAYEGSCTSCHSATGSTLSAIQEILRARLSPNLTVIPVI